MITNTQDITTITTDKRISLYCPIGKDYYTADIKIVFHPDKLYMDYIELDKFLNMLSGFSYTIEDVAKRIYDHLQIYSPLATKVEIEAHSNSHMHVTVTKGDVV